MTVRVVTDSTADIPDEMVKELGITVVPIYVVFGDHTYRDRIDITEDEFYERLVLNSVHPTTSVPAPKDFADVYNKLAEETDEILSIHLTSKSSGTYNSALLARGLVNKECRIEVVDSLSVSMCLGLMVIEAAREAREGKSLEHIAERVRRAVPHSHLLILLDTLKYVVRGGRLGKAPGLVGTVLRVRPLLTIRDGELAPAGIARTKAKAIERLFNFAKGFSRVKEMAVAYTTTHDEAKSLVDRIKEAFPDVPVYLTRCGASLGTHAGPGAMGIVVRESEG